MVQRPPVLAPVLAQVLAPQVGERSLKETRWGGTRLAALHGRADLAGRPIGESWEFSTIANHSSRALDRPLPEVLGSPLPFLVKLIDTARWLSIQVHPDDSDDELGKEEAWVVLDAAPGAHVLAGLRSGVTASQLVAAARHALHDPSRADALVACLQQIPVCAGTVVLVPAGTLHAIGPDILLAEIQQPADRTFRLFDYGSGRTLHVQQALDTMVAASQPQVWYPDALPRELRGKHLFLDVVRDDQRTIMVPRVPTVVVPVKPTVRLFHDGAEESLDPGQLRLCVSGSVDLTVDGAGLAVLGHACDV